MFGGGLGVNIHYHLQPFSTVREEFTKAMLIPGQAGTMVIIGSEPSSFALIDFLVDSFICYQD